MRQSARLNSTKTPAMIEAQRGVSYPAPPRMYTADLAGTAQRRRDEAVGYGRPSLGMVNRRVFGMDKMPQPVFQTAVHDASNMSRFQGATDVRPLPSANVVTSPLPTSFVQNAPSAQMLTAGNLRAMPRGSPLTSSGSTNKGDDM